MNLTRSFGNGLSFYWRSALTQLALVFTLSACDSAKPIDSATALIRDSAGVELIDFSRLPTGDGPVRFAVRARLRLGGLNDNNSLEFDTRGLNLTATSLADGQIVVGDHQRLKFFDARGRLLRIVGRGGYGPGEFSSIRDLCPQADSSHVVIDEDGRWTVWSRDGSLRDAHARIGLIPSNACSTDGAIMVREVESTSISYDSVTRRMSQFALYNSDGTRRLSLGRLLDAEYYPASIFFEPRHVVYTDKLLLADPRHFELRTTTLDSARLIRRWKVNGTERELTQAAYDSMHEAGVPKNTTAERRAKYRARVKEIGKPPHYPAFWQTRADRDGRLWINPYFDHQHWYVVDKDGTRISLVTLPLPVEARPQLVGFVEGSVVIRHVDDDGAAVLSFFDVETTDSRLK